MALRLDVADAASIAPAFDEVEAGAAGPISILINNAGVSGGMALDMTIEHFDATFDVNVRATYFAARRRRRG